MEREIWDVLVALESGDLTIIEAHQKICNISNNKGKSLLKKCLIEQKEVINSPIRFNGVHVDKIKQTFMKNGISLEDEF